MRHLFIGLSLLVAFSACNCAKNVQEEEITTKPKEVKQIKKQTLNDNLIGEIHLDYLEEEPYNSWYSEKDNYTPKSEVIEQLKQQINNKITIEVFFGTWCSDSQQQIPMLVSILDEVNFKDKNITYIAVGKEGELRKKSPDGEEVGKNIKYVPTIIVYKNGEELDRIVEQTQKTLEEDLLTITSGEEYKHYYE